MRKAKSLTVHSVNSKCNTTTRRNARTNDTVRDQWQRKQAGSTRLGSERGCQWQGQRREALLKALGYDLDVDAAWEQMELDNTFYRSWVEGEDLIPPCYADQSTVIRLSVPDSVLEAFLPVLAEGFKDRVCMHIENGRIAAERAENDRIEDMIEEMKIASGFYGSW